MLAQDPFPLGQEEGEEEPHHRGRNALISPCREERWAVKQQEVAYEIHLQVWRSVYRKCRG